VDVSDTASHSHHWRPAEPYSTEPPRPHQMQLRDHPVVLSYNPEGPPQPPLQPARPLIHVQLHPARLLLLHLALKLPLGQSALHLAYIKPLILIHQLQYLSNDRSVGMRYLSHRRNLCRQVGQYQRLVSGQIKPSKKKLERHPGPRCLKMLERKLFPHR
jgi:hypothetical protein